MAPNSGQQADEIDSATLSTLALFVAGSLSLSFGVGLLWGVSVAFIAFGAVCLTFAMVHMVCQAGMQVTSIRAWPEAMQRWKVRQEVQGSASSGKSAFDRGLKS